MTRDEVIAMAKEARIWLQDLHYGYPKIDEHLVDGLERLVNAGYAAGAAAEREALAQKFDGPVWSYDYREIAAAIRARGDA